jgi:hypothetical protein
VTASFVASSAGPSVRCVVPRLTGRSLKAARSALAGAHCALGKVTKPKKGKGTGRLVVRSSSPGAGAILAAGGRVSVKLRSKPKRR